MTSFEHVARHSSGAQRTWTRMQRARCTPSTAVVTRASDALPPVLLLSVAALPSICTRRSEDVVKYDWMSLLIAEGEEKSTVRVCG
jgi:hypothetical protein